MSFESQTPPTEGTSGPRAPATDHHRIGFVGPDNAGKTTVAAMVAERLTERTVVEVVGEAGTVVDQSETSSDALGELATQWTVVDYRAGTDSVESAAGTVDTLFVVTTPETLDRVASYERVAARLGLDVFLVVNRFTESDRDRLKSFDGPEIAEYFYDDETVSAGELPTLEERTTEAILLESLQPERLSAPEAIAALGSGRRDVVNVEVKNEAEAIGLIRLLRRNGYAADFFRCNCRCHDGHVLARVCPP
ncbi:hypothetical protein [Haloarcula laminariae]|uniref:hypothetical protein n=1 Tax=Haloarcula laminariae TaxID=2961577 RepID=UPI002407214B|nr:hypothetical protein [Halomicroarcula sp. FL173]